MNSIQMWRLTKLVNEKKTFKKQMTIDYYDYDGNEFFLIINKDKL